MGGGTGQNLEGLGQQGVAGQDGGGFVEFLVHRRSAPAQIVIVHGRQIVMGQGIAMDHLDGGGDPQSGFLRDIEQGGGLQHEKGAQALAAVQAGVAHGLGQPDLGAFGQMQQAVQDIVHFPGGFRQGGLEKDAHPMSAGWVETEPSGPMTMRSTLA